MCWCESAKVLEQIRTAHFCIWCPRTKERMCHHAKCLFVFEHIRILCFSECSDRLFGAEHIRTFAPLFRTFGLYDCSTKNSTYRFVAGGDNDCSRPSTIIDDDGDHRRRQPRQPLQWHHGDASQIQQHKSNTAKFEHPPPHSINTSLHCGLPTDHTRLRFQQR